ncbi:MAG: epoxyqueuosine reductase QueH [Synergistales bacterium]|nr:epoxyqueuosine reductase QueH [Synergistales bacterium]
MQPAVLLHICCAPDATVPVAALSEKGYRVHGFFYGSNIHPAAEYRRRREAVQRLSEAYGFPVLFAPYEPEYWLCRTRRYAAAPEGGRRCGLCFWLQLAAAAVAARERGFPCLDTTLTISPHKDVALIHRIGERAADAAGPSWLAHTWRKNDGFGRSVRESRRLGLFRQHYCGCIYSLRKRG